ncbi:hypothetical protein BGW36DRAFT_433231 [Talaromyces proteolyticus]|uniref:Uncharacterized protein n=1 Tax=Talaromyces proteolyticus TaxID=1131652 RepID=A0AAD4PV63_9EURO|nr:uncharacterized protein BGW36DRAFT_433231 [Talaromyces proteolyticus]KAH8690281.1 hypothetical protein BGW36DRAFT_433231 [Talaromyces proteolyticus]
MTRMSRWYYAAVPAIAFIVVVWSLCWTPSWTGILSIDQSRWSSNPLRMNSNGPRLQKKLPAVALSNITASQRSSITNCVSNMIIVSDKEEQMSPSFQPEHDIISDLPEVYWDKENVDLQAYERIYSMNGLKEPTTRRDGWLLDRFKFLPMMEYAYERNEAARWFFFVEADTYIV